METTSTTRPKTFRKTLTLTPLALLLFFISFAISASVLAVPLEINSKPSRSPQQPVASALNENSSRAQVVNYKYPGDTLLELQNKKVKKVGNGGSDCWGWKAPDGIRWAIMGVSDAIVFVEVEGGRSYRITAPNEYPFCGWAYWRDMATYQNYCYSVSECSGINAGLMIIDMSFLPDSVSLVGTIPISPSDTSTEQNTSHNLAVDTVTGTLYIEGSGSASAHVYRLADPANPEYLGKLNGGAIHDLHAVNDTVYLAGGGSHQFSVWVRQNPTFPFANFTKVAEIGIPFGGYVHNTWTNHDRTIMATTEETIGKTVKIWDISDLTDIQLLGEYLGPNEIAHNVHIQGDRLYISHYTSGVRVVDISDPTNPTEIEFYNTASDPELSVFESCWGVWPHDDDGWVYASDMNGMLYILLDTARVLEDSIWIEDATAMSGEAISVDIVLRNSSITSAMTVPFSWSSEFDVAFSSVDFAGTRTENFEIAQLNSIDHVNKRGLLTFVASTTDPKAGLSRVTGPIARLNFTLPTIPSLKSVTVSLTNSLNPEVTLETTLNYTMIPDTSSGILGFCLLGGPDSDGDGVNDSCDICPGFNDFLDADGDGIADGCDECPTIVGPCPCCDFPGDADNSGSTTIGDVTFLITHIFSGGVAPECDREGDANGDGALTIGDITYLIANIFTSGPAPSCL